jgi:hypothetical protein
MRLVTVEQGGKRWPGVLLDGERVLNLASALTGGTTNIESMLDVIAGGQATLDAARAAVARAPAAHCVAQADVRLIAPIPVPAPERVLRRPQLQGARR